MFDKEVLKFNLIGLLTFSIPAIMGWTWFGFSAFLVGLINLIVCPFCFMSGYKKRGLTLLLCGEVLLSIGYSICSTNFFFRVRPI